MAEEKFDPLKEGPRSFAVLLAGMRDEGEESATDVLMAYFHQDLTKEEALSKLDAMQSQWIQQQPMGLH